MSTGVQIVSQLVTDSGDKTNALEYNFQSHVFLKIMLNGGKSTNVSSHIYLELLG